MTTLVFFLCLGCLAAANGANDASRAAATLVGGRVTSYRHALWWTIAWTFAGSLLSGCLGAGVARRFAGALGSDGGFRASAVAPILFASFLWVAAATFKRIPVATTHALLGSLVGVTWIYGGWQACARINLSRGFVLPLLSSPLIAIAASVLLCRLSLRIQDRGLPYLNRAHWVSAGLTAFSRGVNDSAKIWAMAIPLTLSVSPSPVPLVGVAMAIVALAMLGGAFVAGRGVTENLAFGVTTMSCNDSVVANIVTSTVLISASLLSYPAASSHVVSGAIFGVGLSSHRASLRWKNVAAIAGAWIVTLPAAAVLSAAIYVTFNGPHQFNGASAKALAGLMGVLAIGIMLMWLWKWAAGPRADAAETLRTRLIVFVCGSNTSRSPMAAQLCSALLAAQQMRSGDITVVSRGIAITSREGMALPAQNALREFGVKPTPHFSSQLTQDTLEKADLVLCMTTAQRDQVVEVFPGSGTKVLRLHPGMDIPNPAGKDDGEYAKVAGLIAQALQCRLQLLQAATA